MAGKNSSKLSDDEIAARVRAAGERAKAEAEIRRKQAAMASPPTLAKEINGPKGPEPTRYSDWERKGLISDF